MLSLYFHELIRKIEEYERKKHLMIDDNILDKVLDKIKKIKDIGKFDDIRFWLIQMISCQMILLCKNVVVSITCVIKDGDIFYPQLFLEETLVA